MQQTLKNILGFCAFGAVLLLIGCRGSSGGGGSSAAPAVKYRLTQVQDSLVSIFENSTLTIQYGYIKNINDGNGWTAGRAGFTSKTGDMLEVLLEYARLNPGTRLERYIPILQAIKGTNSTAGLSDLEFDWPAQVAHDPLFSQAQDNVNNRLYRMPASDMADAVGAVLPLSLAAIYEAGIQHGYGDDYDSIPKIVERASSTVGGNPRIGIDELVWLRAFLEERKKDLQAPANVAAAAAMRESVDRANAMLRLYQTGNYNLSQQITIIVFGSSYTF